MSESLFALSGQYKQLYAMLTEDADDEAIQGSLEAVMGEIEVKGEGYVALINQLDMEEKACEEQEALWKYRKELRRNGKKRFKDRLVAAMMSMGITEIKAGNTTIKLVNNGGKLPLIINGDVPPEYMKTKIIEEKDSDKIRAALDAGKELDFAAYGEQGKHIRFK